MKQCEREKELAESLRWIICRIEEEAERVQLHGMRGDWKKAAHECVEQAYAALAMFSEDE